MEKAVVYLRTSGMTNVGEDKDSHKRQLEAINKFRAQLKGESLNKDGIDSTIHVPGIGTVNHHSDLVLLLKKY